ncbi:TPA: hypothetical protein I8Y10_002672 [Kluyvera cryocrescens]|nr:hypothetical protein [Kluyvera cryocrescens]
MSVRERMNLGLLYTDHCEGLPEERCAGKELAYDYNMTRPSEETRRRELLPKLFDSVGRNSVSGASSAVTKSIPPKVVAVGVPCRVLCEISEADKATFRE